MRETREGKAQQNKWAAPFAPPCACIPKGGSIAALAVLIGQDPSTCMSPRRGWSATTIFRFAHRHLKKKRSKRGKARPDESEERSTKKEGKSDETNEKARARRRDDETSEIERKRDRYCSTRERAFLFVGSLFQFSRCNVLYEGRCYTDVQPALSSKVYRDSDLRERVQRTSAVPSPQSLVPSAVLVHLS